MNLTPNFTAEELGLDRAPAEYFDNGRRMAELLQAMRDGAGGYPLRVTAGWRDAQENADVGGVPDSQHLEAAAADFVPVGISLEGWRKQFDAAEAAGKIPDYGDLILSPVIAKHFHASLPDRGFTRRKSIEVGPGDFRAWGSIAALSTLLLLLWGGFFGLIFYAFVVRRG